MNDHPFQIRLVKIDDVPAPMVDVHHPIAEGGKRLFRGMSGGEANAFIKGYMAGQAAKGERT